MILQSIRSSSVPGVFPCFRAWRITARPLPIGAGHFSELPVPLSPEPYSAGGRQRAYAPSHERSRDRLRAREGHFSFGASPKITSTRKLRQAASQASGANRATARSGGRNQTNPGSAGLQPGAGRLGGRKSTPLQVTRLLGELGIRETGTEA